MKTEMLMKLIEILTSTNRLDPSTIKKLEELAEGIKGRDMPCEKQNGINWQAECHDLRIKLKMAEAALDVRNQEAWEERRRAESAEDKNAELVSALKAICSDAFCSGGSENIRMTKYEMMCIARQALLECE